MELVVQPPGSTLCGQACVAMVAGVPLKKGIKAVGHEYATTLYAIRNGLKKFGFEPAEKCAAFGRRLDKLPETCLLKLTWPKKNLGHWVAYHQEQVYDPAGHVYCWDLFLLLNANASITYLALTTDD